MLKSDKFYRQNLELLKKEGVYDVNPRPKWPDGTPAHSKYITQITMSYNLEKGEFPFPTIRHTSVKMGINEILAIYQSQTNTLKGFQSHNVFWWDAWMNEEGNLGTAYSYNLESNFEIDEIKFCDDAKTIEYIGELAIERDENIYTAKNFTEDEIKLLKNYWLEMFNRGDVCKSWEKFDQFLRDVRYLPQYFVAKRNNFKGFVLSKSFYNSNVFSPETTVFLKDLLNDIYETNKTKRIPLSRNQIVELLKNLNNDPYSRRHMVSLFNWKEQPKKTLVECAFMNMFSVREDKKGYILDQNLIQRSSDFIVASYINATQYVFLGLMIVSHLNSISDKKWRMGKFKYDINNLHCYDRHEKYIDLILAEPGNDKQPYFKLKTESDFFNISIDDVEFFNNKNLPQLPEKLEIAE